MWAQKSFPGGSMIQPASSARLTPSEPGLLPGEGMYPCRCRTGRSPRGWKEGTGVRGAHRTGPTLGAQLRTSARLGCSLVLSHPERVGAWTWWRQTQLGFSADLFGGSSPCNAQLRPLCILAPSSDVCTTLPGWPLLSAGELARQLDRENRSPQTILTSSILSSFLPVSIIIPPTDNAYGLLTMKSLHVLLHWTLMITWWWRHQYHPHITGKEPEGHRGWDPCPRPRTQYPAEPACDHCLTTKLRCRVGASSLALDPIPSPLLRDSFRRLFLPLPGSSVSFFLLATSLSLARVFHPSTHCLKLLDPSSVYCLLFPSFPFLPSPSLSLSLSHFLLFQTSLRTKFTSTHGAHFPTSTD